MTWKKITQQEKYLGARDDARDDGNETRFGGTVYQGHLVTLQKFINYEENRLCFFNLRNYYSFLLLIVFLETPKTWLTFDIKGIDLNAKIYDFYKNDEDERNEIYPVISGLMTYKNYVLSLTAPQDNGNLVVAIMNIESIIYFKLCVLTPPTCFMGCYTRHFVSVFFYLEFQCQEIQTENI